MSNLVEIINQTAGDIRPLVDFGMNYVAPVLKFGALGLTIFYVVATDIYSSIRGNHN